MHADTKILTIKGPSADSMYTRRELHAAARRMARGNGRLTGWHIEVSAAGSVRLAVSVMSGPMAPRQLTEAL